MGERVEPYLSAEQIAEQVTRMAAEIQDGTDGDEPLVLICVLKGSFLFYADLLRKLHLPTNVAFLGVSSYEGTSSTGAVRLTHDLGMDIADRDCVVVEDIVDTGLTMSYLLDNLRARKPRTLRVCTLLHKPSREKIPVPLDLVGFVIDDHFVVGYGLDYEQRYRDLDHIGILQFVD